MDEKLQDVILDEMKSLRSEIKDSRAEIKELQVALQAHQIASNERHLRLENKVVIICIILSMVGGTAAELTKKFLGI
jgi:hypothetical protein